MFYRVIANLNFTNEDEANDFYHDCQIALPKSETINPGQINEEKGTIHIERCHHDEHLNEHCELIAHETT